MAKNKKNSSKKQPAAIRLKVKKHIEALSFTEQEYLDWCQDNGFPASIEKSARDCQEEMRFFKRRRAWLGELTRIHRNPRKLIAQACAGAVDFNKITRPVWSHVCKQISESKSNPESRQSLKALLNLVIDRADFLMESVSFGDQTFHYIDALIKLNDRRGQWIRPAESWRKTSHNKRKQFSSLLRHLLARYPVPFFMDSAWFRAENKSYKLRDWFILLGSGENIRNSDTPIPLTKKMAHHFLYAPDDYSFENALRWGQVHALGGDRRLTEALLATRIGNSFENEEFWVTVIRFLIANPLLDRQHVGPIIDFIAYRKFEIQEELVGPGQVEHRPPPHPNLTMRGRNPESLLRQMNQWHFRLGRSRAAKPLYFKRSVINGFVLKTGREKKNTWRIRQLLSGHDLTAEGRKMHHCVATYAKSCATGHCSIWAMEQETPEGVRKHQTVEVNYQGVIKESRGKYNRLPTQQEYEIIKKWANQEGLTISRYVLYS